MLRLSPFRIQMFQKCKQLYKFFYLDGIRQEYDTPKPPIVMGEHVHRALEQYYKTPADERSEQVLHNLLRKSWVKNRGCFGDDERSWGQRALGMLSMYYQKYSDEADPIALEEFVDARLQPDLVLLGKVDRVDEVSDGLHVIDYKTGREKEQTHQGTLQLLLYALLVQQKYKQPVVRATFRYLASGVEHSIVPTEDDLEAAVLEVQEMADAISSEQDFLPNPGDECRFCDFREICPAMRGEGVR